MKILTKLATALRGGLTEAGEAAVRSQSARILDQEIRDSENAIRESRSKLADTMADQAQSQRTIERLEGEISQYESHATAALEQGREDLATELAGKIAQHEEQLDHERQIAANFETAIATIRGRIRESEHAIKVIKNKRNLAKASRQARRAAVGASRAADSSGSAIDRAAASLRQIEEDEQRAEDRADAARRLHDEASGADLDRRLREAGITQSSRSGDDVLARLKEKAGARTGAAA